MNNIQNKINHNRVQGDGEKWIVGLNSPILVTGSGGFIGSRVVATLLKMGFKNIICSVRQASNLSLFKDEIAEDKGNNCKIIEANLLYEEECNKIASDVEIVYHLVAGRGKSFPACFQGSVITTRNLLNALIKHSQIKRFVNVSSFSVYSNFKLKKGAILNENCPLEDNIEGRYDAYAYGKIKQEELVLEYHKRYGLPYTIVRPGIVIGPGKKFIPGFVGIDTFGFFMHLGGKNTLPLTYIDNCAEAIVLAGLIKNIEGEVFNIVDDQLPKSNEFLKKYKRNVKNFRSISIPYFLTYLLCSLWEWYAKHSKGQLPPVFNRRMCGFAWKGHNYSNQKLKDLLGWNCKVTMERALELYFDYQKNG